MKLLFRNSANGRIENTMYNSTDRPLYVAPIEKGKNKGFYADLVRNTVVNINKNVYKYGANVDDNAQVISYYDGNCDLITLDTPMHYSCMLDID